MHSKHEQVVGMIRKFNELVRRYYDIRYEVYYENVWYYSKNRRKQDMKAIDEEARTLLGLIWDAAHDDNPALVLCAKGDCYQRIKGHEDLADRISDWVRAGSNQSWVCYECR